MALQNQVTKIYRLETVGYSDLHKQFQQLSQDLLAIKKLIVELQGKSVGLKGDDLAKVNAQIREALTLNEQLEQQVENLNGATDKSVSKYFELNKAYKQAKENAQDLAAEFGVESEQAKEAAASAAALKQQLVDINNLVKAGGVKPQAPVVPLAAAQATPAIQTIPTANLADLQQQQEILKETGEVVNEYDKELADATNAAVAFGEVNRQSADGIKQTDTAVSEITTKYEQYTGTIRQNIIAQLENNNQLLANRASQKEIQTAINAQASASEKQLNQMAALREEEQILIETNKALTLTIRNQTKEFIASSGSLNEFQAQLNQLQQTYEQLTEVEKASPFGQAMKAEIDVLEPKVKSLEAELGKFQRNVGNYPTLFGGAFKVLENELDSVRGKLIQGNFSGKDLEELTAKEKVLSTTTETLGATFTTTAQEANAAKEAGRQLAQVYGTDSVVFKEFSASVAAGNAQIKATDIALTQTSKSGNAFSGVFKNIFSQLRNLANIIPGAGIGTLVLLLLTPLQSFATSLLTVSKSSKKAKEDLHDYEAELQSFNKINEETNAKSAAQLTNLNLLYDSATKSNIPLKERLDNVIQLKKQFPEYFAQLDNEIILTGKATEAYKALAQSIKDAARTDAVKADLTDITKQLLDVDKQKQKIVNATNAEKARAKTETFQVASGGGLTQGTTDQSRVQTKEEAIAIIDKRKNDALTALDKKEQSLNLQFQFVSGFLKTVDKKLPDPKDKLTAGQLQVLIDNVSLEISTLKEGDPKLKELEKNRDAFQKRLDAILKKPTQSRGSSISSLTKDALKDVETERNQLLTDEGIKRQRNLEDEETYLKNVLQINKEAIEKKQTLLKGSNTSEKLEKSQLQLELLKIEQETNDKLFEIKKTSLQNQLQRDTQTEKDRLDEVQKDPTATEQQKVQAKLNSDSAILALQQKFNSAIDVLERELNQHTEENAKQRGDIVRKVIKDIATDESAFTEAELKDTKAAGEKSIADFKELMSKVRLAVVQNQNISPNQRNKSLKAAADQEAIGVLAREVESAQKQLPLYKQLLQEKKITDIQYNEFATSLNDKQKQLLDLFLKGIEGNIDRIKAIYKTLLDAGQLTKAEYDKLINDLDNSSKKAAKKSADSIKSLKEIFQKGIQELFKIDTNTDEGKQLNQLIGEALQQTYTLATSAMNNYFDAEQQRIQQSLQLTEERIELEKTQAQARAQTQAEIDSIEKQAQAAKRKAQHDAGEQLKKVRKSEAKVALATQLVNIAVEASQYPFPANLIIGAILTGLALANYNNQVTAINQQQFAFGGMPGEVPVRGGEFGGRPHSKGGTKFIFKNREYEAQIEELAIIKRRYADANKTFTVTGNQMQLASFANVIGGGVDFKPGARVTRSFASGGFLGSSLQAPIFAPSNFSNANNEALLTAIKEQNYLIKQSIAMNQVLAKEQSNRIDRLQVQLNPQEVTNAQQKARKQASIGTLV